MRIIAMLLSVLIVAYGLYLVLTLNSNGVVLVVFGSLCFLVLFASNAKSHRNLELDLYDHSSE